MFRTDVATSSATLPTPSAAGTEGYFTNGNPGTGTPATVVDADWLNMMQEELRAVVVAGGLTPSKTVRTQVRDALALLYFSITNGVASTAEAQAQTVNDKVITPLRLFEAYQGANQSNAANGYQKFPGGLILQWATVSLLANNANQPFSWPITFPSAVRFAAVQVLDVSGATGQSQNTDVRSTSTTGYVLTHSVGADRQAYVIGIGF